MHYCLEDICPEDVVRCFLTNIFAMFDLCQAAVPHKKPGSAIINTTPVNAKTPQAGMLVYATTKGAIATFTVGLAKLRAAQGIRVNWVAPGPVWTPLQPSTKTPDELAKRGGDTPLGRPGHPPLASDEGQYMTGALLPVTGGMPTL
ncbi:SDR family oxidoreductase [Paraburkholderia sp. CNPSo 3272]|uniref:SDR family oxidoreductase n=1 Tax=Paraburkholderia sp. CNPSo 3272 TaxID=2940931 RepID=UPI0020B7D5AA|nr:SDR family oxidoreductase [Paraburkholderia sp. CNPSo 3272]MCP3728064.1 SDR family oxidoreductase [Paraburkholderia sp. CNPSo 3272]